MIGQTISHYRVVEHIGGGGMGVIYRAQDLNLGREVALKFLTSDVSANRLAVERFKLEARSAAALNHPNICAIYDIGEHNEQPFIVMELLHGQTLEKMIGISRVPPTPESTPPVSRFGMSLPPEVAAVVRAVADDPVAPATSAEPIPLRLLLSLGIQLADALDMAHRAGITHRDIKPANIFVTERHNAKILDFGLAKLTGAADANGSDPTRAELTQPGSVLGTVAYMSPEQAMGEKLDGRTDLFSLGAVLYEMATAHRVFAAKTEAATFDAIINGTPVDPLQLNARLPDGLGRIIMKALDKSRESRYQSALELCLDLRKVEEDLSGSRYIPSAEPASDVKRSIAVLPFVNMSRNEDNEYFGDGLAEELINAMTRVDGLHVASRTSAFQFKGKDQDIREIGRALNVDTLLEGSVRNAGDRVRVSAQLINVADGYHLWSERYDRKMEDIFELQDDITQNIVDRLKVQFSGGSAEPVVKRHTHDVEAYNLYLKGRYHLNLRTETDLLKAMDCFEQASKKAPTYALPYAGLAETYILLSMNCPKLFCERNPANVVDDAKRAAQKAVELDGSSAEAHMASALVYYRLDWNWDKAEAEFLRALRLQDDLATVHHNYAMFLASVNRTDEAVDEIRLAHQLDPLSPIISTAVGRILHFAGRYDEAIEQFHKTLDLNPHFASAYTDLGLTYFVTRQLDKATGAFENLRGLSASANAGLIEAAWTYALKGQNARADRALERLKESSADAEIPRVPLAFLYITMGKFNPALDLLEDALALRDSNLVYLLCEPGFAPLRSEPRFMALLRRIGLDRFVK